MNVVLCRVLYTHALVAAPRLSLGWLRPLAPLLGDPRLGMTGIFLQLSRVLPDEYPLTDDVDSYLSDELGFGRLLDFGVIVPRLQQLYEWSARELGAPGLRDCLRDGAMTYAWPFEERGVWQPRTSFVLRTARRLLPPEPAARADRPSASAAAGVLGAVSVCAFGGAGRPGPSRGARPARRCASPVLRTLRRWLGGWSPAPQPSSPGVIRPVVEVLDPVLTPLGFAPGQGRSLRATRSGDLLPWRRGQHRWRMHRSRRRPRSDARLADHGRPLLGVSERQLASGLRLGRRSPGPADEPCSNPADRSRLDRIEPRPARSG